MYKKYCLILLTFILSVFFFNQISFALILPETPGGKIGKNYQVYGFFSSGFGITKKDINYFTNYYVLGLRSNFGTNLFDFGMFYNIFSSFMGLTGNIKYAILQSNNFSSALDFYFSKPFVEGILIKSGLSLNLKLLSSLDLIFSSFYIYSFTELKTTNDISFPQEYSIYFYSGVEFQPPFLIDNTITLGCGYLYLPDNLENRQKFFNQFYINIFSRHAFKEPKIERKTVSNNNIIKDKQQEENLNKIILITKELIKIKEYKKAIMILSDALYFYPDNFTLNLLLADCHYSTGDKIKSFIYYKKASEINTIDIKLKEFLKNFELEMKNEKN